MSQLNSDPQFIDTVPLFANMNRSSVGDEESNDRIRLREWREMYLLVGECRTLGVDGLVWRRHLTKRLQSLLRADLVVLIDYQAKGNARQRQSGLEPISNVESGSIDGISNSTLHTLLDAICPAGKPSQHTKDCDDVRIASRQDLLRIKPQGNCQPAHSHESIAELGDFVVSVHQGPADLVQLLAVLREAGQPHFERRIGHLIRSLWIELRHFQPNELRTVDSSVFLNYPKRMLQVLSCLLAGSTAKETAELLSISVHTVQVHIKRLYKRTSTSNRAELAEFFRDVAPQLIGTPLDEFPG